MQNPYFYSKGIVITRRVWQLLAAGVIISLATLAKRSIGRIFYGVQAMEIIFVIVFILTYFREQRRALYDPHSNVVINWNLLESILYLASIVGYVVFARTHHYSYEVFYGYFNSLNIGLFTGLIWGELLWHNSRLKQLDDKQRERYWTNYKDNLWG